MRRSPCPSVDLAEARLFCREDKTKAGRKDLSVLVKKGIPYLSYLLSALLLLAHLAFVVAIVTTPATAQSPVGYWTFNAGDGSGTEATDASGYGHTAALVNGVSWVTGQGGGAISADAASRQYVSIPAINLSSTQAVTVALWVNRTYSTAGGHVLFEASADYSQSTTGYSFLPDDDTCHGIQAAVRGNAGYTANCYGQPSSGAWHHLAVVFDKSQTAGDAVKFYLDGVLQTPSQSLFASTNIDNFGNNPIYLFSRGGETMFDSGALDDLLIYNTALTAAQIQQIYDGTTMLALAVTPANAAIRAGTQQQFTATGTYGDGSQQDLTSLVTWNSSASSVAAINSGGLATGVATGNTNIQATLGPISGGATVTVTAATGLGDLAAPAGWGQGFDFRSTQNFVTDPPGSTYVLSNTTYPTTVNGVTYGWANSDSVGSRDLSTTADPRLAGFSYAKNGQPATFYVDLPAPGTYDLALAMGDAGYPDCWQDCQVQFLEGSTVLATVRKGLIVPGQFCDAVGNNWSAAAWPTSNVTRSVTLAGTRLTVLVGTNQATGDLTPLSYLGITQPPRWRKFTISAAPGSLSVAQGNQGTSTITTTISNGFNSAIALSASGMPSGTTVSFNPNPIPAPGSGNSTMTITVGASTPVGTYPITVTGNGGGVQQHTTVTLTVTAPPTFTISASPSSLSVVQGNQGISTITATISNGFNSAITLSASGMPSGTTVSFNPNPIAAPGSGSSTMTITVGSSTPTGTYPITVTGNGGGVQQNTTVTLTVTAAPNFTISASPASLSVHQGNQGTSTITTAISGGFNSAISLSASGMPSGTTVSFNPQTIPAPGSGSSSMTITVGSSTPMGTYPITVTGNSGGIQQNTTVALTVTAAPNFTISASPSSLSVAQGNQGTSTITTTVSGGFNSAISLSASGAPSGTTVSFNPNPIPAPGNGSSTMTITVGR